MSIDKMILEIDKEIDPKFKAETIEKWLKVGEALTRVMMEWAQSNETVTEEEAMSEENLFVYQTKIKDLEKSHPSKWGLIANGELECIKDTREELAQELEHRNLIGIPCLMFQIGVKVRKRTFGIGSRIK